MKPGRLGRLDEPGRPPRPGGRLGDDLDPVVPQPAPSGLDRVAPAGAAGDLHRPDPTGSRQNSTSPVTGSTPAGASTRGPMPIFSLIFFSSSSAMSGLVLR